MAIAAQSGAAAVHEPARLICEEAARLYDAMHGLIPRLAPPSLDTLGLADSLASLVRESQRRHPTPLLTLQHQLPADLGASAMLAVYRVAQEGLVNALRHASATRVAIDVRSNGASVIVSVTDDGVGLPGEWSRPGHFGLRGLHERIGHLGGSVQVRNHEPHGVNLTAEIPLVAGA
jgi:two-component system sensor histidine kinase UhpB